MLSLTDRLKNAGRCTGKFLLNYSDTIAAIVAGYYLPRALVGATNETGAYVGYLAATWAALAPVINQGVEEGVIDLFGHTGRYYQQLARNFALFAGSFFLTLPNNPVVSPKTLKIFKAATSVISLGSAYISERKRRDEPIRENPVRKIRKEDDEIWDQPSELELPRLDKQLTDKKP